MSRLRNRLIGGSRTAMIVAAALTGTASPLLAGSFGGCGFGPFESIALIILMIHVQLAAFFGPLLSAFPSFGTCG